MKKINQKASVVIHHCCFNMDFHPLSFSPILHHTQHIFKQCCKATKYIYSVLKYDFEIDLLYLVYHLKVNRVLLLHYIYLIASVPPGLNSHATQQRIK